MDRLRPAETHAFPGPVPTQIVSSEEYFPIFGENVARLDRYQYDRSGIGRSNRRYGYVVSG